MQAQDWLLKTRCNSTKNNSTYIYRCRFQVSFTEPNCGKTLPLIHISLYTTTTSSHQFIYYYYFTSVHILLLLHISLYTTILLLLLLLLHISLYTTSAAAAATTNTNSFRMLTLFSANSSTSSIVFFSVTENLFQHCKLFTYFFICDVIKCVTIVTHHPCFTKRAYHYTVIVHLF